MAQTDQNSLAVKKYPFFIRATVVLFGLFLFCYILFLLSSVLVPFTFACLFAILINPLCRRLQRKLPRGLAIFFSILIALILLGDCTDFLIGDYTDLVVLASILADDQPDCSL